MKCLGLLHSPAILATNKFLLQLPQKAYLWTFNLSLDLCKISVTNCRIPLDRVRLSFLGNALPSHMCIDGINFSVQLYIEPV